MSAMPAAQNFGSIHSSTADMNDIAAAANWQRELSTALERGVVLFDAGSRSLTEAVPSLRDIETAEVERFMKRLVEERIDGQPASVALLDQERTVLHVFSFPQRCERHDMLDRVADWIARQCQAGNDEAILEFESYILPREISSNQPILLRKRGYPLGTVEIHAKSGVTRSSLGITKDFAPDYGVDDEPGPRISMDLGDVSHWPLRRMIRALDLLVTEITLLGEAGDEDTMPQAQCGVDADGSLSMIGRPSYTEQRSALCARIRCLCAAISLRGEAGLLGIGDLKFAAKPLARNYHRELPDWLIDNWSSVDRELSNFYRHLAAASRDHDEIKPDALDFDGSGSGSVLVEASQATGLATLRDPRASIGDINIPMAETSVPPTSGEGSTSGMNMWNVIAMDGARRLVKTASFSQEATPDTILAAMGMVLCQDIAIQPVRYYDRAFEVYAMPYASGHWTTSEIREHAKPLGIVTLESLTGEFRMTRGIDVDINYPYAFQEDRYLIETLDVSDVAEWSTRRILRTLDRLVNEHLWIDELGLLAPFEDYEADVASLSDARIKDIIQKHARLTDAISTRIFALCAALQLRRKPHLASGSELDFALNCTDIDPSYHPGLPVWLTEQWDGLLEKLAPYRR